MNISHTTIIIIALAGGCALFFVLWVLTLRCWCRSRGSKNRPETIEEPTLSEHPFDPRPSMSKRSTLVSARAASKRAESFLEPSLQSSSPPHFARAPSEMSFIPEHHATPISMAMASVPRPATAYIPNEHEHEHGQFRAAGPTHHRSATLPIASTPHAFPPPAPSAMFRETSSTYEGQRQPVRPQHMLPHAASMPRLESLSLSPSQTRTPLGMSTPAALQLPTPFELPPAGQILRSDSPLPNPYEELYGHLGLDSRSSGSESTPTPAAGSRSVVPIPTATPAPTTAASATTSTAAALGASDAISTSGPSTSTSAPASTFTSSAPQPPKGALAAALPSRGDTSSSRLKWGPNEYPPEKREVRLEPPASASADYFNGSSSSKSLAEHGEDFAASDCPPAYSS